jgi:hypothetical protein
MTKAEMQAEIESLRAQLPTPPEPPAPIASKALDTGAAIRSHIIATTKATGNGIATTGSTIGNFFKGLTVGKPKCSG